MKERKEKIAKHSKKEKVSHADKPNYSDEKISVRGRMFKGYVIKKFQRRVVVEFERIIKIRKYERYAKKKTRIHVRLPKNMEEEINVGDYVLVGECRPLSKLIHFVVLKKLEEKK